MTLQMPRELTDKMHDAFFEARDEYQRLIDERIFPRPTLPTFIYEALVQAYLAEQEP